MILSHLFQNCFMIFVCLDHFLVQSCYYISTYLQRIFRFFETLSYLIFSLLTISYVSFWENDFLSQLKVPFFKILTLPLQFYHFLLHLHRIFNRRGISLIQLIGHMRLAKKITMTREQIFFIGLKLLDLRTLPKNSWLNHLSRF